MDTLTDEKDILTINKDILTDHKDILIRMMLPSNRVG